MRVLGNHHIVGLGVEPLGALCQVQNEIGANEELRFFQFLQAVLYYFRLAMDKKDTQGPAPVRRCAFRSEVREISLQFALSQV
jgi:hypothetical protein